ncbi:hypothetical protein [Candidatus Avelusimicrobium stercoris]|uniref:hypothetical protein n=1 Tax=Candidatus Avelusimicrobium stercoris TaxID=1947924 RepID=UPI003D0D0B28
MKKILLALLAVGCFLPIYSQTYYQKVPKLVPVGDGTYRILYEYVPVNERGYASPIVVGQEQTAQENAALNDEAARWARGESANNDTQKTATPVIQPIQSKREQKSKTAEKPYLSIGASLARSSFSGKEEYRGYSFKDDFSDTTPFIKAAFGTRINPNIRTEIFYQYRDEMEDEGTSWEASASLQDFGLNVFLTLNSNSKKASLFIGAGLAGTLVNPSYKVRGRDISDLYDTDLYDTDLFFTPSGYIGIEFPDASGDIITDITLFYSKTFLNRSDTIAGVKLTLEDIDSYGISVNIRFDL